MFNNQQSMNENNCEIEFNSASRVTQTQRKQQNNNFVDNDDIKENKTRIFKYPYLIERSSQKFKQDNRSNNSTQKPVPKTHQRKKIFQPMPKIFTEMKRSTLSADIVRNIQNNFQTNPIKSKLKQSKSKQKRKNSYNSMNPALLNPPSQPSQPVVFNYINPGSQLYHPSVSYYQNQNYSQPLPLPQSLSQPFSQTVYFPTTLNPINYHNQRNYIGSPPQTTYYSVPNNQQMKPSRYISNSAIFKPVMDYSRRIQTYQGQFNHPNVLHNQTKFNQNYQNQNTPEMIKNFNPNLKKKITLQNYQPQHITTKPLASSIIQDENIKKTATFQNNMKTSIENNLKMKNAVSSESVKTSLTSQQYLNIPNLYQTYKPGTKFNSKQNQFSLSTKKIGGNNKQKKLKKDVKNTSISSFTQAMCQNSQQASIDLHEAEQLNNSRQEEPRYSDRFDDMDIKDNKIKKGQMFKSMVPPSNNHILIQDSNNSSNKQIKQENKKNEPLNKKSSITSVMYENQRKNKQLQGFQSQKKSHKIQNISMLNQQGKLMTLVLIGISILLVIFQILK